MYFGILESRSVTIFLYIDIEILENLWDQNHGKLERGEETTVFEYWYDFLEKKKLNKRFWEKEGVRGINE